MLKKAMWEIYPGKEGSKGICWHVRKTPLCSFDGTRLVVSYVLGVLGLDRDIDVSMSIVI